MYRRFLFNNTNKVNDILHSTKDLTLDNKNYTNYVDDYYLKTQEICYKEPNREIYPILKNKEYISLQKQNHFLKEKSKEKEKNKKNNKKIMLNFHIKKDDNKNIHTRNLTVTSLNENNKTYTQTFFKSIFIPKIKQKKNNLTSEFILCNLLFQEPYYNDLKYKEELIFHRKSYYIELLKEKLLLLKNSNENRLNETSELHHKFINEKYGQIELTLTSIKIEIKNIENPKSKIYTFDIPFDYVPLFLLCDFRKLKQILIDFLQCNIIGENNKIKPISFNIDYLNNNIFEQIDNEGNIISYRKNLNLFQDYKKDIHIGFEIQNEEYLKYLKCENEIEKMEIEKEKDLNVIIDDYYKIYERRRNSIIFNSSNKKYEFNWINPKGIYLIKISMPNVFLRFINLKKFVNHFIDKKLFVYLLEKKFVRWDFYIVHYLFSIKYFRAYIQNILSKKSRNIIFDLKHNSNINFELNKIGDNEFFSIPNKYNISFNNSLSDLEYSFILTDDKSDKNYLFKIYSYFIYVYYPKTFGNNIYKFQLNFQQMKIMYLRSKRENLENFILKLLHINSKKIYLDYSYFSIFNDYSILEIEEYFNRIELKYNNNNLINNEKPEKIQIFITNPKFEIIQMKDIKNNNNKKEKIWLYAKKEIEEELLIQLIQNDINDWPGIIYNHQINFYQIFVDYNHLHDFKNSKTYSPPQKRSVSKVHKKSVFAEKFSGFNLNVLKKKSRGSGHDS